MRHPLLTLLAFTALSSAHTAAQDFAVANRGSGDVTVFDQDGNATATVALPGAANAPEPMYVVQVGQEVIVGDRANDCIVRFDRQTWSVLGTVPVGDGVFHMWSNGRQLWVNNDIDNTTSVVDTRTWQVLTTVAMPPDLVTQGYKCHDVFVARRFAYVSMLGAGASEDFVVQFDLHGFAEQRRTTIGLDPHLWWDARSNRLFVASQNANAVQVLDGRTLALVQSVPVAGAHGIFLPAGTHTLLTTNIAGGGTDGLIASAVGPHGELRVSHALNTPYATPHNIAASARGRRIFVTHSGAAANQVSIYRLRGWVQPRLEFVGETQAGLNPFGLAALR